LKKNQKIATKKNSKNPKNMYVFSKEFKIKKNKKIHLIFSDLIIIMEGRGSI
jgi:hypothetical protein